MLALVALAACSCGSYDVHTNVWYDHINAELWDGDPTGSEVDDEYHDFYALDGAYDEECGLEWGTWGMWDLMGDGWSILQFDPHDADFDRDINGLAMDIWAAVPAAGLVAGATFDLASLKGEARLRNGYGETFKLAYLTEGTVTVTSGEVSDDPCTEDEGYAQGVGPAFGLRWDLVWEDAGHDVRYAASGGDDVHFDASQSEACNTLY